MSNSDDLRTVGKLGLSAFQRCQDRQLAKTASFPTVAIGPRDRKLWPKTVGASVRFELSQTLLQIFEVIGGGQELLQIWSFIYETDIILHTKDSKVRSRVPSIFSFLKKGLINCLGADGFLAKFRQILYV